MGGEWGRGRGSLPGVCPSWESMMSRTELEPGLKSRASLHGP